MKFLGADSDFGAVAEFEAVGEAGGGVDVDYSCIDFVQEFLGVGVVVAALNWTPPPQSLVVASFNGIHICALCESFLTSSFYQVIFLFLPRSKPLLQG